MNNCANDFCSILVLRLSFVEKKNRKEKKFICQLPHSARYAMFSFRLPSCYRKETCIRARIKYMRVIYSPRQNNELLEIRSFGEFSFDCLVKEEVKSSHTFPFYEKQSIDRRPMRYFSVRDLPKKSRF